MQEVSPRVAAAKEIHLCFNCGNYIQTQWHLYIIYFTLLLLTFLGNIIVEACLWVMMRD